MDDTNSTRSCDERCGAENSVSGMDSCCAVKMNYFELKILVYITKNKPN